MIMLALKYFLIFCAVSAALIFCLDRYFRSEGYKGAPSDHFDGTAFMNIGGRGATSTAEGAAEGEEGRGRLALARWLLSRDANAWTDQEFEQAKPAERVMGERIVVTYVNHASVLIQTNGKNIITDPIYAERASPVSWAGPRRYANPGVAFDDLPPIDVVLLSHNHYDHMDLGTLRRLREKSDPTIIAPLGNAAFLAKKGIEGAIDLDWWQSHEGITLVPSQHFSARALSDRNKTLWGGYVISYGEHDRMADIYFAGDTGYGPFVGEIAARYPGGFRLGILPIGAYEPRWIMSDVHVSPDEALRMKAELGIARAFAMHFGTFKLADDRQGQPKARMEELAAEGAPGADSFVVPRNGQSLEVKQ